MIHYYNLNTYIVIHHTRRLEQVTNQNVTTRVNFNPKPTFYLQEISASDFIYVTIPNKYQLNNTILRQLYRSIQ